MKKNRKGPLGGKGGQTRQNRSEKGSTVLRKKFSAVMLGEKKIKSRQLRKT